MASHFMQQTYKISIHVSEVIRLIEEDLINSRKFKQYILYNGDTRG